MTPVDKFRSTVEVFDDWRDTAPSRQRRSVWRPTYEAAHQDGLDIAKASFVQSTRTMRAEITVAKVTEVFS